MHDWEEKSAIIYNMCPTNRKRKISKKKEVDFWLGSMKRGKLCLFFILCFIVLMSQKY